MLCAGRGFELKNLFFKKLKIIIDKFTNWHNIKYQVIRWFQISDSYSILRINYYYRCYKIGDSGLQAIMLVDDNDNEFVTVDTTLVE